MLYYTHFDNAPYLHYINIYIYLYVYFIFITYLYNVYKKKLKMECFLKNQILDTNTYNTTNIIKIHMKKC